MDNLQAPKRSNIRSIYIHIPFCNSICSYCDFCKFIKNKQWVSQYLKELEKEIISKYQFQEIKTIYIGGGTPSCLSIEELRQLFDILKVFNFSKTLEFTFECNIENIDHDKLKLLYNHGVNRLSIGVQTFNEKFLKFLNRKHTKKDVIDKIKLAKEIGFKNINVDLMYAFKDETLEDLNNDIDEFLKLDITHISTYSLIIEPNTKLYVENIKTIDEDIDYDMYCLICNKLKKNGYTHYEISNYSKKGYESKHNLTYWNNLEYYGFGIGASGYINGVRYDNTRSINRYLSGNYISESHDLSIREKIENEFILGFRKLKGINKKKFYDKYHLNINDITIVHELLKLKKLKESSTNIYIDEHFIYTMNDILLEFLDIDYEGMI